jgi:SAM-dependent methyltransferase
MSIGLRIWFLKEQCRVIRRFYRTCWRFAWADITMGCLYFFTNPYRICRKFFQKKGEAEIYVYGETPLSVWAKIAEKTGIGPNDFLVDLGCGRGRLCLWSHLYIGCRVTGVDWIPSFIYRARFLAWLFRLKRLTFVCGSISRYSLEKATVVYLYTYHLEENGIDFQVLAPKSRIISVSEPVNNNDFIVVDSLKVRFPWGETEVYVSEYSPS